MNVLTIATCVTGSLPDVRTQLAHIPALVTMGTLETALCVHVSTNEVSFLSANVIIIDCQTV